MWGPDDWEAFGPAVRLQPSGQSTATVLQMLSVFPVRSAVLHARHADWSRTLPAVRRQTSFAYLRVNVRSATIACLRDRTESTALLQATPRAALQPGRFSRSSLFVEGAVWLCCKSENLLACQSLSEHIAPSTEAPSSKCQSMCSQTSGVLEEMVNFAEALCRQACHP